MSRSNHHSPNAADQSVGLSETGLERAARRRGQIAVYSGKAWLYMEQDGHIGITALVLGAGLGRRGLARSATLVRHDTPKELALPMASFYSRIARGETAHFSDLKLYTIAYNSHSTREPFCFPDRAAAAGYKEKDITLSGIGLIFHGERLSASTGRRICSDPFRLISPTYCLSGLCSEGNRRSEKRRSLSTSDRWNNLE